MTTAVKAMEPPMPSKSVSVSIDLTLNDRCDSCGSEGMARILMPLIPTAVYRESYDLVFCGHHMRKHELAIASQGGEIHWKESANKDRF